MPPVVDTAIRTLGPSLHDSPLALNVVRGDRIGNFVSDKARVRHQVEIAPGEPIDADTFFEKAGPRQKIFFDPRKTRAAIVTCGGLCPGLNNVIRSAFLELHHNYGVREVLGIRHGYQGLTFKAEPPLILTPGDNEWADCGRLAAGSFDPLDRLDLLRSLMPQGGRSFGRRPIPVERQMLHAARLGITHPQTGVALEFNAPMPDDMRDLIRALRE